MVAVIGDVVLLRDHPDTMPLLTLRLSRLAVSGTREESVMSASTAASVSVVLVHGGFVDGSGWQGVYSSLRQHGYRVGILRNPTISLDDDVAVTKRVIAAQPGRSSPCMPLLPQAVLIPSLSAN